MKDQWDFDTEVLNRGAYINGDTSTPETAPIYMTTAFNVEDLDALYERYANKDFCYNRNRNPNRRALGELMSYVENGEESVICSSGMAAISTAVLAMANQNARIVSSDTLYGETLEVFDDILKIYGVETTYVDFTDLDKVRKAVNDETTIVYTETVSNPMISVADIEEIAKIAHAHGALLIVDNTFVTAVGYRPLEHGADLVVNSLTKFANGHSDAVCGSVTGRSELMKKIYHFQILLGTTADPVSSWMVQRGMRTMSLRVERQMENAAKLAEFFEKSPYVRKAMHPSLKNHPQHELALSMFGSGERCTGMLSIYLPEDIHKLQEFMRRLKLVHYAMTLGGFRTTIAHPVSSSHYDMPKAEREKIGITDGLLRISVGIENIDDLVADFTQALEVYKEQ